MSLKTGKIGIYEAVLRIQETEDLLLYTEKTL
jgi:hypothetical protein